MSGRYPTRRNDRARLDHGSDRRGGRGRGGCDGPARGLRADAPGKRLHPRAQRGHHAVRRLQRVARRVQPVRRHGGRLARQPGRLLDRLRIGYAGRVDILEKHGKKLHIKKSHLRMGRPLVRAPRRRHGVLHAHAADHPHLHLASGRRGPDALLALQRAHPGRLHALGPDAHFHRQAGGRQLGGLEGLPALRGLRGGGRHRDRRGLPLGARPAPPQRIDGLCRRPSRPDRVRRLARAGAAAGRRPGTDRAAAGVELGPPRARGPPARLGLRRACHRTCARHSRWRCTRGRRRSLAMAARRQGPRRHRDLRSRSCHRPSSGLLLEKPIERRLGGPASVGVCQVAAAGGAASGRPAAGGAGRRPPRAISWPWGWPRRWRSIPGVSRSGAALTRCPATRAVPPGGAAPRAGRRAAGHAGRDGAQGRCAWLRAACLPAAALAGAAAALRLARRPHSRCLGSSSERPPGRRSPATGSRSAPCPWPPPDPLESPT